MSAKTVRAALGAAKALGLDPRALAETHGVLEAMADVDARFPHSAWLALWRDMARATGSEALGLEAAERLPWGHFEVVDYVVGTSDDLGTALRRFERYFALVSTGVAHVLEDHGDAVPPDDRSRAGSAIKTLIATAVLQSVEKGALGLDDALTDLLPPR